MQSPIEIFKNKGCKIRRAGNGFLTNALHRDDKHPSLSVFPGKDGIWRVHDFSSGNTWALWNYLMKFGGMTKEELIDAGLLVDDQSWKKLYKDIKRGGINLDRLKATVARIMEPVSFAPAPGVEPPKDAEEKFIDSISRLAEESATQYLKSRGFDPNAAADAGVGVLPNGSLVFAEQDVPDGPIRNLKIRRADDKDGRFMYMFRGVGNGFYMAGDLKKAAGIAIVEGEVNAASFALAMPDRFVIGMPGASKGLTEELARIINESGLWVELWFDNDDAGRKGIEKVKQQLERAGVAPDRIIIPLENPIKDIDLNDVYRKRRVEGLREHLLKRLAGAKSVVKTLRKSARAMAAYLQGQDCRTAALEAGIARHATMVNRHAGRHNPRLGVVNAMFEFLESYEKARRAYRSCYLKEKSFAVVVNLVASALMGEKARPYDLKRVMTLFQGERLSPGNYDFPTLPFLCIRDARVIVLDWAAFKKWLRSYIEFEKWEEGDNNSWFGKFLQRMEQAKHNFTVSLVKFFKFLGRTFNGKPIPAVPPPLPLVVPTPAVARVVLRT